MNFIKKKTFRDLSYWKLGSNLFGKPKMFVHCFLIDGLLIDTGQPHIRADLLTALQVEGVDKIVVTHHHEDHAGNIEAIKKLKGVAAFASEKCCELMKNPKIVEPPRYITWGQPRSARLIPFPENLVNTDKYQFQVLDTPGHATDQISLYESNQGWLFSGDLFLHDYQKVFMRDEKIGEHITSLKRLLKLDFDVLLCNHQPIFSNGKIRLKSKLSFLEDFYGKVERHYLEGWNAKEIMKILGFKEELFMKLFSFGQLSRINMVNSVIQNIDEKSSK